ncbi:MAG: T9SS type A sorting domain-containing protein [Bacteroidota bacterium]|nr:T9SS type A sorting domain-containing protein [Bacteroidota bacterium]
MAAHAQFNYDGSVVTPVPTYTDLGTNGTLIATANTDEANSTAQNIGFPFTFNNVAFTQFVLNTNGVIRLGSAPPSTAALHPDFAQAPETGQFSGSDPADVNLLAPFNIDLIAGSAGGTEYRVSTTGTAPNRICTIQWKNVADKATAASSASTTTITTQLANVSFQVKLYETTNTIDFVYSSAIAGTGPSNIKFVNVGIKGSTAGESIVATKPSTGAWSSTAFVPGPYDGTFNAHNVRQTVLPDAGRTYRFSAASPNDAAVNPLYIQGQLSAAATPQVVMAGINNRGLQPYAGGTAVLTVKRGTTTLYTNTKTIPAIPVGLGGIISFDAYPAAVMSNAGTNTVTVTLSSDDNTSNNTASLDQVISATTFNFASPGATTGAISFNGAGNGTLASRFTTTKSITVNSVQVFAGNALGSIAGVLLDANGAEVGRSAVRTLAAADAGTLLTLALPTPVVIPAGDFYAAAALSGMASLGTQTENPTRTDAFYQITAGMPPADISSANLGRYNLGVVTAPVATAVRNAELAAAITLSPNPASQRFTLSVPAGSLRSTVATLANALGQTVQTRQLNLPAAGGTADFDVSRLAAGVYTLTLQSGTDLVVKRVVVE